MPATTAGTSEYDRFGPWIDEVRTRDDVPRLFRDDPVDVAGARLVLKVPRNIARRDATPDMDLYDHLLVLEADALTVLSRRGGPPDTLGGYDRVRVPLGQIVALRDVVTMLDGRLTVSTPAGDLLSVRYNGSARAAVARLVGELRGAAADRPASPVGAALRDATTALPAPVPPYGVGKDDLALVSDLREVVRRHPDVTAWSLHGRTALTPTRGGALARARNALSPATLHGAVLAGDATALEVLGRHDWVLRGRSPVHSASRTVIPWSAPEHLTVAPHPDYERATLVRVSTGAAEVRLVVPTGSAAEQLFAGAVQRLDRPLDDQPGPGPATGTR